MSGINTIQQKNPNQVKQYQTVQAKSVKPDFIPLVKADTKQEENISTLSLVDTLNEQMDAFTKWMDKVTGMDKVKELNKLKDNLIKVMDFNKIEYTADDIDYWAKIIEENSRKSNLSKELLVALVQRETSFRKCIASKTGNGPLQVTSITVKDLFSDLNGGRLVHYNNMDRQMMDEILYKKDIAGNKVPRFNNYKELHRECATNDNLGMKVGIMCFKMKFAEAVASKKGISIESAINGLKSGEIILSKSEQKSLVKRTLVSFNSVFTNEYASAILDSIARISPDDELADFNPIVNK